jgi:hypothetical protein
MVAGPLEQLQLLERQDMALVSMEQRLAGSIWSTQLVIHRSRRPRAFPIPMHRHWARGA